MTVANGAPVKGAGPTVGRRFRALLALIVVAAWWAVFTHLEPFARWTTYTLFSMASGSRLWAAVEFFLYDVPKVLMLLTAVVFVVGMISSYFTPERTRAHPGRQARRRATCWRHAGRGHAVLLLLGRAAVHRLRHHRRAAGRDVLVPDLRRR